ncbi:MAG: hypothetical protein DMG73_16800 [Acidobacteria bacterium]|nr:MAG: hypothetical protein DMG73_16800 [Acidobacteriota bacterium]PYX62752.1 MAG: hypothetical protein DMG74_19650 [Acidobacteriota bacterium]
MSAGLDFASSHRSRAEEVVSTVPLQSFSTTAMSRLEGRPVVRSPEQLRVHRALDELDLMDVAGELNDAARLRDLFPPEPILITTNGTILVGLGRWRLALLDGRQSINCIEYAVSEEPALEFILAQHQPRRGWNAFVRTCLALTLEPYLQQRALENMRIGGKYKGSASLPDLPRIDVRQAVASVAGIGARTVSNVKKILKLPPPKRKCNDIQSTTGTESARKAVMVYVSDCKVIAGLSSPNRHVWTRTARPLLPRLGISA